MTCPICSEETVHKWRPFCSKRCADIDLGRWFNGSYRVAETDEDEAPEVPLSDPRPTEH